MRLFEVSVSCFVFVSSFCCPEPHTKCILCDFACIHDCMHGVHVRDAYVYILEIDICAYAFQNNSKPCIHMYMLYKYLYIDVYRHVYMYTHAYMML